jgi:Fe-S cluster biosynthesis and repair protein YggX
MTIFDSIKHPVTDELCTKDLTNIPNEIWCEWIKCRPVNLNNEPMDVYAKALRKFILEYEV